jgi:Domain of Unknown Function (DUF1080)
VEALMAAQHVRAGAMLVLAATFSACSGEGSRAASDSSAATTAAAAMPQKSKGDEPLSYAVLWTPLIDEKMSHWRAWKSDSMPTGWTATADGVLTKSGQIADLESREQFANFELEFDWMVGEVGNAGVFYRVTEEYDKPYWSGPEYQLLDDARHPDGKDPTRTAGSAYALYAPPLGVSKPANEWNTARIVVAGKFVEHWLNGQQVVQYQLSGADWTGKVKASKFADFPNYGLATRGFLSIQGDHAGTLSIRGMRIRDLP